MLDRFKMKTNCSEILLARNRTKKQHKVYLYEAEINMLNDFAGGSVSENVHAIIAAFLKQTGHIMSFLKEKDHLQINNIHRAIAQKQ
jgi:hypothetical protein